MAKQAEPTPSRFVTTLRAISDFFEVSSSTVREWRDKMPRMDDGKYDLAEVSYWKLSRSNDPANRMPVFKEETNGKSHDAKYIAEVGIKQEELKARKRRNEIVAGDYVERSDVDRFFAEFFGRLRDDLGRIPGELKASFPTSVREDLSDSLQSRLELTLRTLFNQRDKIDEIMKAEGEKRGRPLK